MNMILFLSVITIFSIEVCAGLVFDTKTANTANKYNPGVVSQENFISMMINFAVDWSFGILLVGLSAVIFLMLVNMPALFIVSSGVFIILGKILASKVAEGYLKSAVESRYKSQVAIAEQAKKDLEAGKISVNRYDEIINSIK